MTDKQYELLTSSRYYLEIRVDGSDDRIDGYFMECQGFERTQEAIEFCQVTPQKWGKDGNSVGRVARTKIPGNSHSGNLILRRGMTVSMAVWDWFSAVEQGNWAKQRRNGDLTLYNQNAIEQARFRFLGAWPIKYKISDVSASNSEFEIEEMELVIDEFSRIK
ncbi:phage tail protein [Nostoc sp. LPT]|uniref:phage tail protein n=1 Tax=Nostoc sp. LPT TaxID=2815387 RepID=UPI001D449690|nr:phage tail protein [Nostoc sp. LPT]MBN4003336.1 phage tail protein [Nostoc sp. LPT]